MTRREPRPRPSTTSTMVSAQVIFRSEVSIPSEAERPWISRSCHVFVHLVYPGHALSASTERNNTVFLVEVIASFSCSSCHGMKFISRHPVPSPSRTKRSWSLRLGPDVMKLAVLLTSSTISTIWDPSETPTDSCNCRRIN